VLKSQKDSEEDNEAQVEDWRKLSSHSVVQLCECRVTQYDSGHLN